jgi:rhamnose transport system ATP-binding protein
MSTKPPVLATLRAVSMSGLKLERIEKSFAGIPALKPLDLELEQGQVLGLVGENGAGKSTLIRILSGVYPPNSGRILWRGRVVRLGSPRAALELGIATIHQELASFGSLTVAENLLLGQRWPRYSWGGVNWSHLYSQAQATLAGFEIEVSPERLFRELSAAQQQEIAIARALSRGARLLILDEPTASLSEREAAQLLRKLIQLRNAGAAILYVSHRLGEVLEITDRIAVLRDGALIANYPTRGASLNQLVQDMVGRPLEQVYPHTRSSHRGEVLLALDGASRHGLFQEITLRLHAGEIVGLAGLIGSGRSEVARAIFGLYPLDRGSMSLLGTPWQPAHPLQALAHGLVYVPEERKRQGFVADHSLRDSVSIGFSDLVSRRGIIPAAQEENRVSRVLHAYNVRFHDPDQPMASLSGGNQQKALLGRWLDRDPHVIILDEPTRGVDVGAKAEIHSLIDRLAGQGKGILLISSDLPEILGMSDRVLVLHRGRISAELTAPAINQENILRAASGLEIAGLSS